MLFPNVFIGKIWRKSQKGVYLQRQKISKRCVIYQKLLFDKLEVNEGMLIENIVSQMLTAAGNKLFFYSKSSEYAEDGVIYLPLYMAPLL